ncbi:permease prefix domain 1-containing protein [Paenibacillus polysaccharolyticus]|uniref:permease prefix domain 1-containing protein n=1 Tax=Paenibacillus polysaccharolyticus TaxID=582692 RepID=UPI00203F76E6|nr:permease prefix domain 1-containing protein [Paenibacillus polysaccharolyticus]MCM3134134.1 permease prefix domain 1-containing protein [Paenibacillus polysaccharolyticus]
MTLERRINRHLDGLFAGAQDTQEHRELKEEIRSNLAARIDDYLAGGMSEERAFQTAIQHIDGMEQIMSDYRHVKRVPYWTALWQSTLIYSLVAWIITIPTRVMLGGAALNNLLLIISLIVGAAYVFYLVSNRGDESSDQDKTTPIRMPILKQWQRRAWWLWAAVMLAFWGTQAALRFGSNIWFNRPIQVDGPYQLAVILIAFALPLLSILIPLVVHRAYRIISKYEVSDGI